MATVRLDKRLVGLGVGSRTEVARLVRRGRVQVAGVVVRRPDTAVDEDAVLAVDGEVLVAPPEVVAWHKPVGVLTSTADAWGRSDLSSAVPELLGWGLHPVGRLDKDTSGLLLFSRDGGLTQGLLHPRRAVPRRYRATVEAVPDDLEALLAAGVTTAEGTFTAEDVAIDGVAVSLTVREGKHRMVRRMLANAGAPVVGLHRLAYGPVSLDSLDVGQWRILDDAAVAVVREAAGRQV